MIGAAYVMCSFAKQCVECGVQTGELGQLECLIICKKFSEHTVQVYFVSISKYLVLYICTSVTALHFTQLFLPLCTFSVNFHHCKSNGPFDFSNICITEIN
jgi:hypothetical protein